MKYCGFILTYICQHVYDVKLAFYRHNNFVSVLEIERLRTARASQEQTNVKQNAALDVETYTQDSTGESEEEVVEVRFYFIICLHCSLCCNIDVSF